MINIFRKKPIKVKIVDFKDTIIDEILFVSSKKGGVEFFGEVKTNFIVLDLFPEDTIKNLKEKIYLATDIFPCEQCLMIKDEIIGSDISFHGEELKEDIGGIPLNRALYQNRNEVKIYDTEYQTLDIVLENVTEIKCRNLKSIESYPDDNANIELIYWSIVKYFPYFSFEAFNSYTKKIGRDKYPLLFPDRHIIERKLKTQTKYLNNIYDMFENEKLDVYNVSLIDGINNNKAELKFNIDELYVLIQQRGSVTDLQNLFTIMQTTKEIPVIIYNNRTISMTKVYHTAENQIPLNIYKNKNMAVYMLCENIIFEIRNNGSIYAIINNSFNTSLDFKKAESLIDKASDVIFKHIDNLKLSLFKTAEIEYYYEIVKISTTLIWFRSINDFSEFMADMVNTQLTYKKKDKTFNKFVWSKGAMTDIINYWNEFIYLTDSEFDLSPINHYIVENKYTELIFTLKNMTNNDFRHFMKFLVYCLKNANYDTSQDIKKNNLKMLRILDPNTYDFGRSKGDKVYARFCQKQKQPIPILPDEIEKYKKDRVLKFWNYTKQSDLYFYCPNDNYPIAGFITGHHPEGNCFVCCKKKKTKNSKYEQIHNICMEDKYYTNSKDLSRARYVINYGKSLDTGRLGLLPSLIVKFLAYNENDYNIISESRTFNVFKYNSKIYSIDRLLNVSKNTKIQEMPVELFEEFMNTPVWRNKRKGESLIKPSDVLHKKDEDPKMKKIYKKIMASNLNDPIFVYFDESIKKFIVLDGFHRLTAAYVKKVKFIKVKMITAKQLDRCYVGKYNVQDTSFLPTAVGFKPKTGGSDKEPFYYLYGIPTHHNEIKCTFLNCIASVFQMNVDCFLDDIIVKLAKVEYIGKYNAYDIKEHIKDVFKNKKFISKMDWEEIFESILPILYDFNIIILRYKDSSDILISFTQQNGNDEDTNYVILVENNGIYNPVYVAIPYIFSKNREIEKRSFMGDDHIVSLFKILCEKQLQDFEFTISKVAQIKNITKVFSFGGMIYAVEVEGKVFVSVEQSKISELSYDALSIKDYKIKDAVQFLADYSREHGLPVNVNVIYICKNKVCAYGIYEMVNFVTATIEEAKKQWPDAKIEHWNYAPEIIINAKNNQEDPLYNKYMTLNEHRDDYEFYKKDIFTKNQFEKVLKKKAENVFEKAFQEEANNVIKFRLMKEGIYNYRKFYLHKQKNENIYIKVK